MATVVATKELKWLYQTDRWALIFRSRELLQVVPDETYPGMWRIAHPNGTLSDMANLTWAKEGAISRALSRLNQYQERRTAPPLVRSTGVPATTLP